MRGRKEVAVAHALTHFGRRWMHSTVPMYGSALDEEVHRNARAEP